MSSARAALPLQHPQITVRQFESDDRAAVGELFVDGFPLNVSPELHAFVTSCLESDLADVVGSYIAPGGNFWVATIPDTDANVNVEVVVGMVALEKKVNGDGELRRMSVKQDFRRLGVGRLLVAELERWAKANAFKTISLWTGEDMKGAQQFYVASGFTKKSERAIPEDPTVTVFEFAKEL